MTDDNPDDLFSPPKSKSPDKGISHEDLWNERFNQLKVFKERFGSLNVPSDFKGGLGKWTTNQRQKKKRGDMRYDREEKLIAIGFEFEFRSVVPWMERFRALKEYKKKHGHCNVPQNEYGGLGNWVSHQRHNKAQKNLLPQREKLLADLGLEWKLYNGSYWENSYNQLVRFKEEHGHCNVTLKNSLPLGRWVKDQRKKKKLGKLPKYQEDKLLALGMRFKASKQTWDEHFQNLAEFKKIHGHCHVPLNYKKALGSWLCKQRYRAREGHLSKVHVQRLRDLGIDFGHKHRRGGIGAASRKVREAASVSDVTSGTSASTAAAIKKGHFVASTVPATASSSALPNDLPIVNNNTGDALDYAKHLLTAVRKMESPSPSSDSDESVPIVERLTSATGVLPNDNDGDNNNCTANAFNHTEQMLSQLKVGADTLNHTERILRNQLQVDQLLMQQHQLAAAINQHHLSHYSLPVLYYSVSPSIYTTATLGGNSSISNYLQTQIPQSTEVQRQQGQPPKKRKQPKLTVLNEWGRPRNKAEGSRKKPRKTLKAII